MSLDLTPFLVPCSLMEINTTLNAAIVCHDGVEIVLRTKAISSGDLLSEHVPSKGSQFGHHTLFSGALRGKLDDIQLHVFGVVDMASKPLLRRASKRRRVGAEEAQAEEEAAADDDDDDDVAMAQADRESPVELELQVRVHFIRHVGGLDVAAHTRLLSLQGALLARLQQWERGSEGEDTSMR